MVVAVYTAVILLIGFMLPRPSEAMPMSATVQAAQKPSAAKPQRVSIPRWTPRASRSYARTAISKEGWYSNEYRCLSNIWDKESNWRHTAYNDTPVYQWREGKRVALHAGGIPQILGLDPKTPPTVQIQKGIDYIKSRYSTPCKAWTFWQRNGWY